MSFEVLPRDEHWEDAELARALEKLNEPKNSDDPPEGCRILAFLGTDAAVDEMIRRHDDGGCRYYLNTAMFHARDRGYAVGRLEAGLRASDQVVTVGYLRTLALLSVYARRPELRAAQTLETKGRLIAGGDLSRRRDLVEAEEARYSEMLASALSSKTGRAHAVSTQEHLAFLRSRSSSAPPGSNAAAVARQQLIAVFSNLPESRQINLLEYEWREMGHADMLPLLRQLADGSGRLADLALRRLYELSPDEGRWRILDEIRRPRPGASLTTLGILPDASLPALEEDIARGLEKEFSDLRLGLLHRYASASIAPRVLVRLGDLVGRTACRPQAYALAYLLRAVPQQGAALLDRALASRNETGCFQSVLLDTATLHMTSELEEAAIARLDDEHPRVVLNAVETLGRFGSSDAVAPLRAHFQTWQRTWRGRASELRYNPALGSTDRAGAINTMIEMAYVNALAARPGVVAANELRDLCVTDGCRGAVEAASNRTGAINNR